MKSYVNDETRSFMEAQFADCTSLEEVADLYAVFQIVTKELLKDRISDFERTDQ
jgi:hypothetical protein